MSVFNQVENPERAVDNEEVIVNDFVRRIPYWSYRTTNYRLYEPFTAYQKEIDEHLEKLFAGEIDDANDDILDVAIMNMTKQAEKFLKQQRIEHHDVIKSFDIRAKSDKKAFEHQLELLKEELEKNKLEQERYGRLLQENEFLNRRKRA